MRSYRAFRKTSLSAQDLMRFPQAVTRQLVGSHHCFSASSKGGEANMVPMGTLPLEVLPQPTSLISPSSFRKVHSHLSVSKSTALINFLCHLLQFQGDESESANRCLGELFADWVMGDICFQSLWAAVQRFSVVNIRSCCMPFSLLAQDCLF